MHSAYRPSSLCLHLSWPWCFCTQLTALLLFAFIFLGRGASWTFLFLELIHSSDHGDHSFILVHLAATHTLIFQLFLERNDIVLYFFELVSLCFTDASSLHCFFRFFFF